MFDYVLYLLGFLSTDSIVADFSRTQRRLERHAARHDRTALRHDRKVVKLSNKAHRSRQEMMRADAVARKIADLVA